MKEFRQIKAGERIYYLGIYYPTKYPRTMALPCHAADQPCAVANKFDGWRIVLEEDIDLNEFFHAVRPKDIYGETLPKIPEGYKVTGFRRPEARETYLKRSGCVDKGAFFPWNEPRFILSPLGPR
jgi:hypothetical protein